MEPLEPMPTPPAKRWREFNRRFTPILVFVFVLILVVMLWNQRMGPLTLAGEVETVEVQVSSPQPGVLAEYKVRIFQTVAAGEVLARVVASDPKNPLAITAPVAGAITALRQHPGERIAAGEPLLTLSVTAPDRIVGFLRQPMRIEPKEGMAVEVRARARNPQIFRARIERVGPQLTPIRETLLPLGQTRRELGLPLLISVPPELKLYPGEIVDLRLLPSEAGPPVRPVKPVDTNTVGGALSNFPPAKPRSPTTSQR